MYVYGSDSCPFPGVYPFHSAPYIYYWFPTSVYTYVHSDLVVVPDATFLLLGGEKSSYAEACSLIDGVFSLLL